MSSEDKRVIALIDMDCFYVQVEERDLPENKGKPGCVVQYKKWKGGGIIAVNYEARAKGVTRMMRGDEAREKCPECILYRVPEQRGKADLTKYRDAGKEVIDVLWSFGVCIERASIDEAYVDMTAVVNKMLTETESTTVDPEELPNTFIIGSPAKEGDERGVNAWLTSLRDGEYNETNWKLALAAVLCERMRAAVYEKTGFRCSAGISGNKMLAKLACGVNKPNKQTVMPADAVSEFFLTFPLKKVRNLGGKLGLILREELNCTTMGDVANLSMHTLEQHFDTKTAHWLYRYARGVDPEPVSSRRLPKSIGCNKNFTGTAALDSREKIHHWLEELCSEVAERLEKDRETNQRTAKLLTLTVRLDGDIRPYSYTRSLPLSSSYDKTRMARDCLAVMAKENPSKHSEVWDPVVTCMGVSASKFVELTGSNAKIDSFFTKVSSTADAGEFDSPPSESNDAEDHLEEELGLTDVQEDSQEPPEETPVVIPASIPRHSPLSKKPDEAEPPKRMGFFASRAIQKKEAKPAEEKPSTSSSTVSESFSVKELFPDLDHVDMETLKLLPLHLQREIRQAMDSRGTTPKASDDGDNGWEKCESCGLKLLKEEVAEHKDYHLAVELQKEISVPAPSSSNVSEKNKSVAKPGKPAKRPLKETKKKASSKDSKRSRTIETFFRNSS